MNDFYGGWKQTVFVVHVTEYGLTYIGLIAYRHRFKETRVQQ